MVPFLAGFVRPAYLPVMYKCNWWKIGGFDGNHKDTKTQRKRANKGLLTRVSFVSLWLLLRNGIQRIVTTSFACRSRGAGVTINPRPKHILTRKILPSAFVPSRSRQTMRTPSWERSHSPNALRADSLTWWTRRAEGPSDAVKTSITSTSTELDEVGYSQAKKN